MIVVVDASVIVAELLRHRGRELFAHPNLRAVVAEDQWDEAEHEITKRLATIVGQGRLAVDQAKALHDAIHALVEDRVIEIIPRPVYEHMEPIARRRVPRDPDDWPPVALALTRRQHPHQRPRLPGLRLSKLDRGHPPHRTRPALTRL